MKTISMTLAVLLAAAVPAAAWPFALRAVPAAASAGEYPQLTAANFNADSRREWYAGGNNIVLWPAGLVIELPQITLPSWPAATVIPINGIPFDVDLDGDTDIVRINRWGGHSYARTLQVFLNNGHGAFYAGYRTDWDVSAQDEAQLTRYRFAAGDFDRDGDADLVISTIIYNDPYDAERGTIGIRWNKGAGTGVFDTATALRTNGVDGDTVLVHDYDRDGDEDIFTHFEVDYNASNHSNRYYSRLYLNGGTGSFTSQRFENFSIFGTAADLNRDGWMDLPHLARWQGNHYLESGLNPKDGTVGFGNGKLVQMDLFCTADANEDGRIDAVGIDQPATNNVSLVWVKGDGAGAFGNEEEILDLPAGTEMYQEIAAGDHDADGDMDFLLARKGELFLVENRALRREPAWISETTDSGAVITDLETVDLYGDGMQDLLAVAPDAKQIRYFRGKGDGSLAAPEFKNTNSQTPSSVVAGDWDRDGDTDVAYTQAGVGVIRQALNTSSSFFLWPDSQIAAMAGADRILSGSCAAYDGDVDLVVSSRTNGQIRWLANNGSASWSGVNVAGTLSPAPAAIAAANLTTKTGDELFYVTEAGRVAAWHHNGSGSPLWSEFAYQPLPAGADLCGAMAMLDVSGTVMPEVVFASGSNRIHWWNPALQNAPVNEIDELYSGTIRAITPVDWDRDGLMDFLCAHSGGVSLYIRRGSGFDDASKVQITGGCHDVVAIDLNRDGLMDAAASAPAAGRVYRLINTSGVIGQGQLGFSGSNLITAGQTVTAFSMQLQHPGRAASPVQGTLADPPVAVTGHTVRLFKASKPNGSWIKGAAMTASEAQQAISTVDIAAGGTQLGFAGAANVAAGGNLAIAVLPNNETAAAMSAGATREYQIRVTLRPTAGSASYQAFFIETTGLGQAKVLDNADPARTGTFGWTMSRVIEIDPLLSPLQAWRKAHFGSPDGTGSGANHADYDGDGVPNLVEYATGTNPTLHEPALNLTNGLYILPVPGMRSPLKFRLAMNTSVMSDPKVRLTVQMSSGLIGWASLASRTGGGSWAGLQPDFAIPANGVTTHLFTSTYTPQNTRKFFLRLRVEELP